MTRNTISESSVFEAVLMCLKQKGKSITDIENEHSRKYTGDKAQQVYRDEPVWHNKRDLVNFVIRYLEIDAVKYASRSISVKTARIISILRVNGTIQDWNAHKRFGLWKLSQHPSTIRDFIVIVGKRDEERFRQFKIQHHQDILQSIKDTLHASNIWALNSHKHYDLWSTIREGDRVFFASLNSEFSYYGTVYKTLQSRDIATKLWGISPRVLLHDCLILFSSTEDISKPFHETCRNTGIKTPVTSDGVYLSKNKILGIVLTHSENTTGIIIEYDNKDGPSTRKSEVVTRFIRDTKKVRQLKKKYGNKCQVCGYAIQITNKAKYSEVHHIHPLKDGGDDNFTNMLVLCPTHHVEFDYKIIGIDADRKTIIDRGEKRIRKLTMYKEHKIAMKNIKFHMAGMNKNEF